MKGSKICLSVRLAIISSVVKLSYSGRRIAVVLLKVLLIALVAFEISAAVSLVALLIIPVVAFVALAISPAVSFVALAIAPAVSFVALAIPPAVSLATTTVAFGITTVALSAALAAAGGTIVLLAAPLNIYCNILLTVLLATGSVLASNTYVNGVLLVANNHS